MSTFAAMKVSQVFITALIALLLLPFAGKAAPTRDISRDSVRISLLTCAAGQEIYSLFGHTAIRYENFTTQTDVVYNYGVFDFSSDGFVLRFALGETDYRLDKEPTDYFCQAYYFHGRDVWQQVLNLTPAEKQRLVNLLETNYLPQNRIYRYNFFYDNCSTRPRDKIEDAVEERVDYGSDMSDTDTDTTFRDLIDRYSKGHPWSRLAMNLCLGSEADKPISRRMMEFVPFLLQADFSRSQIVDSAGQARPLVTAEGRLVKAMLQESPRQEGLTPMKYAWLLFSMTLVLTLWGMRKRKSLWGWDVLLFGTMGIAGCILAFLVFFSQHPCMSPNYLLFVFHPLHLFCLPWLVYEVRKGRRSCYLMLNLLVLTLFMAFWAVIPQKFPPEVVPLALCLWMRSMGNYALAKKKK